MTELETIAHAKSYLEKMANGINPLTGEAVPETDLINQVRISRCLFFVSDILRKVIEQGGVRPPAKIQKIPFSISRETIDEFRFSDTPIPVSEITNRINALIDESNMKKLKYGSITGFLVDCGFLEVVIVSDGKTVKRPTEAGKKLVFLRSSGTEHMVPIRLHFTPLKHSILSSTTWKPSLRTIMRPAKKSQLQKTRGVPGIQTKRRSLLNCSTRGRLYQNLPHSLNGQKPVFARD